MSWIEVKARVPYADDLSPWVEIYRDFGVENTMEEEGPLLVGCMVDVEGSPARVEELVSALRDAGALEVTSNPYEETDWEESWKKFFKPRRIGQRFVVRPTWEEFEVTPGDLTIVLDPGLAFGTGDHPTTRMCLELLENAEVEGKRVADVGCGSGILSIGACMLGAAEVDAVDIEPASVEVSLENAELNRVKFRAIVGEGVRSLFETVPDEARAAAQIEWEQDERPLGTIGAPPITEREASRAAEQKYDIVVSNIISAILIRISPDVAEAVKPGGQWIVSGIILGNWPEVLTAAERVGFSLLEKQEEGDWVAARFLRVE